MLVAAGHGGVARRHYEILALCREGFLVAAGHGGVVRRRHENLALFRQRRASYHETPEFRVWPAVFCSVWSFWQNQVYWGHFGWFIGVILARIWLVYWSGGGLFFSTFDLQKGQALITAAMPNSKVGSNLNFGSNHSFGTPKSRLLSAGREPPLDESQQFGLHQYAALWALARPSARAQFTGRDRVRAPSFPACFFVFRVSTQQQSPSLVFSTLSRGRCCADHSE
jgi:hypothetical protein